MKIGVKGVAIIEVIVVITILAIIIFIAVPKVLSVIGSSREEAFKDNAKAVISAIELKKTQDKNYDVSIITAANIDTELGLDNDNYEMVEISIIGNLIYVYVVGQNKWEGVTVYGTNKSLTIIPKSTPEVCFDFSAGTIIDYNYGEGNSDCTSETAIPSEIGEVEVTAIAANAFEGSSLTSVAIPPGVVSIGNSAFSTNNITSIYIPDSVTTIGDSAFYDNDLTNVIIPDNVTSIGDEAFCMNALTAITIPNSVTTVGDSALMYNYLTSITLQRSDTTLGMYLVYINDEFRTSYLAGGAGTYIGTQPGTWTKQ